MNIKAYLANHSPKPNLNHVIINWFLDGDNKKINEEKSKTEWEQVIKNFFRETEKDRAEKIKPKKSENPKENQIIKDNLKEQKDNKK